MEIDTQRGTPMTAQALLQANKDLVRAYTRDVFNAHKPERAAEFLAPEAKWHGGTLGTVEGRDNIVGLLQGFIGALPDIDAVEQEMVAEGNSVWVRYVINATHQGDLLASQPRDVRCSGPPSTSTTSRRARSPRSGPKTTCSPSCTTSGS